MINIAYAVIHFDKESFRYYCNFSGLDSREKAEKLAVENGHEDYKIYHYFKNQPFTRLNSLNENIDEMKAKVDSINLIYDCVNKLAPQLREFFDSATFKQDGSFTKKSSDKLKMITKQFNHLHRLHVSERGWLNISVWTGYHYVDFEQYCKDEFQKLNKITYLQYKNKLERMKALENKIQDLKAIHSKYQYELFLRK